MWTIARQHMLSRLRMTLEKRSVMLVAGTGYGKTSLLADFVTKSCAAWLWYDLSDFQNDALSWARQFLQDVSSHSGGHLSKQSARLRHGRATIKDGLETLESLSTAELRSLPTPLYIVIDNYDSAIIGGELAKTVSRFLAGLPTNWRFLIATKREPTCPRLNALKVAGKVDRIDETSLAFSLAEISSLLDQFGPEYCERIPAIHLATAGWPAGVILLKRCLLQNIPGSLPIARDPETYRHVLPVFLSQLEPSYQEFLVRSAVLPYLEVDLCNKALGRKDSATVIEKLKQQGLILSKLGSRLGMYVYESVLRNALVSIYQHSYLGEELRATRVRAGRHLFGIGQFARAAEQFIAAGDWDAVSEMLGTCGEQMIYSGQTTGILRLLDQVPTEQIAQSPWMLFYRARCLRLLDRAANLRSTQQRAQALFTRVGNGNGRAAALLEEAKAAELDGNIAEAAALCSEALTVVNDDVVIGGELRASLVLYDTMLGRLSEAQKAGEEALEWLKNIEMSEPKAVYHTVIKRRMGLALAYAGAFDRALVLFNEACELGIADQVDYRTHMRTLFFKGFVEGLRGDFEQAFATLDQAEQMAQDFGLSGHVHRIAATKAEILTAIGQFEVAEAQFRRARWISTETADPGYFYYRTGQLNRAIDWYEHEIARAGPASHPVRRARAQAMLGATLVCTGELNTGKQLLEQSLKTHTTLGFHSRIPGLALHLADLAASTGSELESRQYLGLAFTIGEQTGARHFFAFEPGVFSRSLTRARIQGIAVAYAEDLENHWMDLGSHTIGRLPEIGGTVEWQSYSDVLSGCENESIRLDLVRALDNGTISVTGIRELRSLFSLTWRELQVFVRYYLSCGQHNDQSVISSRRRLDLANELGITETTLRYHITSIRSKLGLTGQRGLGIVHWAINRKLV